MRRAERGAGVAGRRRAGLRAAGCGRRAAGDRRPATESGLCALGSRRRGLEPGRPRGGQLGRGANNTVLSPRKDLTWSRAGPEPHRSRWKAAGPASSTDRRIPPVGTVQRDRRSAREVRRARGAAAAPTRAGQRRCCSATATTDSLNARVPTRGDAEPARLRLQGAADLGELDRARAVRLLGATDLGELERARAVRLLGATDLGELDRARAVRLLGATDLRELHRARGLRLLGATDLGELDRARGDRLQGATDLGELDRARGDRLQGATDLGELHRLPGFDPGRPREAAATRAGERRWASAP